MLNPAVRTNSATDVAIEPPVYSIENPDSTSSVLILCDHAAPRVPAEMHQLGLAEDYFRQHIAFDIGALDLSLRLAQHFACPMIHSNYSRLVIDLNRRPGGEGSIAEISDGIVVPGNAGLNREQVQQRQQTYFWPYHRAVNKQLQKIRTRAQDAIVLSIHSFTPEMDGVIRPWHIGILWNNDDRLAAPLIRSLRQDPVLCIGDNKPYHARSPLGYTMPAHAESARLKHVLLEFRQDLIETPAAAQYWADLIYPALQSAMPR